MASPRARAWRRCRACTPPSGCGGSPSRRDATALRRPSAAPARARRAAAPRRLRGPRARRGPRRVEHRALVRRRGSAARLPAAPGGGGRRPRHPDRRAGRGQPSARAGGALGPAPARVLPPHLRAQRRHVRGRQRRRAARLRRALAARDRRAVRGVRRGLRRPAAEDRVTPALLVMTKAPAPGRSKTRLTPPCTPEQAAGLARAALEDTLASAAAARRPGRRVVVLDGEPGPWLPPGFDVVAQRGSGRAERLAAAFEDVGGPAFLVGMDTPQVTPALLDAGLAAVTACDSVFGAARDGGYWGIGLQEPDSRVFDGVPMSSVHTGALQRARLAELGLTPAILPPLIDVDTSEDARAVAAQAPRTRFAAVLAVLAIEGVAA